MAIREVKNGFQAIVRTNGRNSRRIAKTFRLKTDAKKWEIKTKNLIDEGKTISNSKITVKEYLEHWHTNIIPTSDRDVSDYSYQRIKNHSSRLGHILIKSPPEISHHHH